MKTVEELLRPRYKVIADYPGNKFQIGDVLTYVKEIAQSYDLWVNQDGLQITYNHFGKYPHLFQPLPWWSDRNVEDMPQYVKSIKQEYDYGVKVGRIIKVKEWVLLCEIPYVIQSPNREYHPSCFVPATREEYELFKQQKINKQ